MVNKIVDEVAHKEADMKKVEEAEGVSTNE
jgi:hypothetical protein